MSNLNSIVILTLLVAAFATADFLLYRQGDAVAVAGRAGLADCGPDVREILVRRKGSPATRLKCADGVWQLVEPFAGTADERVVLRLIDAVEQTPPVDVVSEAELLRMGRTRADFSLEDPLLTVEVTTASKGVSRLMFGLATPADGGVYAAVEGVDAVYVVSASVLSAIDVSADGFRQRALLPVDAGEVSGFTVQREGDGPMAFARSGEGWTVGGRKASSGRIAEFLAALTSARAVSFVWPVSASNETAHVSAALLALYGLDAESAVAVTLTGTDGSVRRIAFGKGADAGFVYALVQDGGAVVTVPVRLKDFVVQDAVLFADPRLFPVEPRTVTGFALADDGGLFSLSRNESAVWRLESPVVAPANQEVATAILSRILSLTTADVATAGGVTVSVSPQGVKGRVSRDSVFGDWSYEDLRSREMLRIDGDLVRRVVSQPAAGVASAVVYDRERRAWHVERGAEGGRVGIRGVSAILTALSPLTAVRVEKLNVQASDLDDYGLDRPYLTVAIDQVAGETVRRNILIGKRAQGGRFATVGSSDAVFVIAEPVVRSLSSPIIERK